MKVCVTLNNPFFPTGFYCVLFINVFAEEYKTKCDSAQVEWCLIGWFFINVWIKIAFAVRMRDYFIFFRFQKCYFFSIEIIWVFFLVFESGKHKSWEQHSVLYKYKCRFFFPITFYLSFYWTCVYIFRHGATIFACYCQYQ